MAPPHGTPGAPQLSGSDLRSTHCPATSVSPGRQTHWPPLQKRSSWQALPQLPQLRGSFFASTQLVPHAVKPASQPHAPLVHRPKLGAQSLPQAPQCSSFVATSTHEPPQTTSDAGQAHWPETQLAPVGQSLPQLPQLFGSEERSTQPIVGPQLTAPGSQAQTPD